MCIDTEGKALEVARKDRAVLYESSYAVNGCPVEVLKEYFPDFIFDYNKEYLIEIDNVLYDGDTLKEYVLSSPEENPDSSEQCNKGVRL